MIHLFIWREWDTLQLERTVGHWEHWKTLPADVGRQHVAWLRRLGLEVEYVGF